jgi:hypothetical protein
MSETITRYNKIVKLPVDGIEQSRPIRAALDEGVHQAIIGLTTHEPKLQITRSSDEHGNCNVHASVNGYDIVATSRSGQDSVFLAGERRVFISYSLCASSNLRSLDRAASISREMTFILRGVGGALFAGLFFCGIGFLLQRSGMIMIRLPVIVIIFVVLAGAWVGERLGNFLGNMLESRASAKAERSGALPQLERLWPDLEQRFNKLLHPYEGV